MSLFELWVDVKELSMVRMEMLSLKVYSKMANMKKGKVDLIIILIDILLKFQINRHFVLLQWKN